MGGISWSSYWATLISATVENAAPTHVVLTFPTAKTELGASDFTIAGFTISSASWAGAVLTLALSYPVTYYSGNLTITFVATGETAVVTNNVAIANTVGWYVAGDGSSTYVTKDVNDLVSVWKDLSGSNHPLNQANVTLQPKWESDGILFDGVDNCLASGSFTYNQPQFYYIVLNQLTNVTGDGVIAQANFGQNGLIQQRGSDTIRQYTGMGGGGAYTAPTGSFFILRALFNATSSYMIINNGSQLTASLGNVAMDGLSLANYNGSCSNIKVREFIARNAADDAATQTAIYNYLATKYGMTPI